MNKTVWWIAFGAAALVAALMGFGWIGHADPGQAFLAGALLLLISAGCLCVEQGLLRQGGVAVHVAKHQGSRNAPAAPSRPGNRLKNLSSWARSQNPTAIASVAAWVAVIACLIGLSQTDEPFWWVVALAILFHTAVILTLAWGGKTEEVYGKTLEHVAILWAYASVWAMILAAVYGYYEENYLNWWEFRPFWWASLSFLAAILAATGVLSMAGKALGKAVTGGFGNIVAFLAWGIMLVPLGVGLILGTNHEFDFEVGTAIRDPLLLMVGTGMGLLIIGAPLAYLLKFK